MMQQIAKQQLHTIWAIWYWLSTAMPHTQVSQKHAAEWGALLLIQKHQLSPNMGMVHNIIQSSMQSCHQPWKKNLGALYINAKQAAPLCQMLCELGHPWPPMLIQTNNFIAYGIIAGIPKIPNTNSGQQTNDLGKKTQPKMWKGTDLPKHGKRSYASMWMNQQAQVRTHHSKYLWKVPPNMHSRNTTKKAISTFKNHFKAILTEVD